MTLCAQLLEQYIASDLQEILDNYIAEYEIPGAILYVLTPDGEWDGTSGVANLTTGTPMTTNHLVRIATITQLFVAVIVLQLMEEEKLSLEDTLADCLPAEICDRLPNSETITIRNLLQHTSGLADYEDNEIFESAVEITESDYVWTAKEAISYAYDLEAGFAPEEYREYSNTNYVLLELIIEKVTGNSFSRELQSRICKNLDLEQTFVEGKDKIDGEFAKGYADLNGDDRPDDMTDRNNAYGLADCGMISNIYDVATFLEALFVNEELLEPKSLKEMTNWYETRDDSCYGLGIDSWWDRDWGEIWLQEGHIGGFYSTACYLPDEEISIVFFANHSDNTDPNQMLDDVLNILLEED